MREHGVQRGRDRRHAARENQTIFGAFERREFLLSDALRRVAVAAVLFAFDAVLKVVVQLLRIAKSVSRRLHDGRGQGVPQLRARLAAMNGQRAETERSPVAIGRTEALARLVFPLAHQLSSKRTRST